MIHVGITGGIGAGKSAALEAFGALGARTLDTDAVVHRLYTPGSDVCRAIRSRWGASVSLPDGGIDRAAVAGIVFNSARELAWLNQTVHPRVRGVVQAEMGRADSPLFCAVPLLFEAGWASDWGLVVALWCDAQTQWARLRGRGWTPAEIGQRVSRQLPMDEKLLRSDIGIINTGSLDLLARQCRTVYRLVTDGATHS
jgi:dephospho-CoA kinase